MTDNTRTFIMVVLGIVALFLICSRDVSEHIRNSQ